MKEKKLENIHTLSILTLVIVPLVGTALAMVLLWNHFFFWRDAAILLGMYVVTTIGVTAGYHRMVTHQGFQAPEWLRGLILIAGAGAFEGKPLTWVTTHIVHHAYSDEEGDPHSPLDGFWHAHIGWLFSPKNFADPARVAPHLLRDRTLVFVDKFVFLWMGLALLIPFLLGGFSGLLWGGAVRIFLTTHITWSVNSICHTFGRRPFETTDESRNNWIIGLIGLGEGWHNNHHAFPQSAFHGLHWWQFDLTGILIRILEAVGLIWNVERVSREIMVAHRSLNQSLLENLLPLRYDLTNTIQRAQKEILTVIDRRIQQEVTSSCAHALRRLEDIQERLAHSANLRRKQLMAYQNETREILDRFRHQVMPSSRRRIVAS